jgi:hypothetical protein
MIKKLPNLICIVIICILSSCAASYKRINPGNLKYPVLDDSTFSYQYNVIQRAGNRKLAKKEAKSHMRVVAVKIFNNTGQTLEYRKNFRIYSGNTEVSVLSPVVASAGIKQTAGLHLLYLLLTPTTLNVDNSSSIPIGLILGPGIALGNMFVASGANKRFREELLNNELENRQIANGESFYGLITIDDNGFLPLSLKLTR